jgi:hypothetical protein
LQSGGQYRGCWNRNWDTLSVHRIASFFDEVIYNVDIFPFEVRRTELRHYPLVNYLFAFIDSSIIVYVDFSFTLKILKCVCVFFSCKRYWYKLFSYFQKFDQHLWNQFFFWQTSYRLLQRMEIKFSAKKALFL